MNGFFTPDMKLSDMIDMDYGLVHVVSRLGIDLGHSWMKAGDACALGGIDPGTFILVCNVYSFPGYSPTPEDIASVDIPDIVRYLHGSHAYYLGSALEKLERLFDSLLEPCDERRRSAVMKFYVDYKTELEKHFAREENEVFPYIRSLGLSGGDVLPEGYSIGQFEEHHESVDEKMEDMKNIVMKYLPEECDQEKRAWVLLSIYRLRDDLRRHTYVEDNILVPAVRNLERNGR